MKSKLFPLISILTLIILFGTAATCNLCGRNLTSETTSSDTEESEEDTSTQDTEEETAAANTQEDSDTTQSSQANAEKKAPTISLAISEGPTYSSADDVCWWRVKATVTGSPAPTITWSQDVSNSSFGKNIAQVNLTRDNPDYTLTATATNSEGSATDDIDLSWGCDGEEEDNHNPVITGDVIVENLPGDDTPAGGPYKSGQVHYTVRVDVADPDGDPLTYYWYGGGGYGYSDPTANPTEWITPDGGGTYYLKVVVKDGRGGEAEAGLNVTVAVSVAVNHPPEILGNITVWSLSGDDTFVVGSYKAGQIHYRVLVDVSDPDGDPLTYNWDGGGAYGYTDRHANPTEWITPDGASTYYIHVTVKDGRGGEAETGINVTVRE
jgi:hypothetical protein